MSRVLLTGATGFVGRHAVAPLLEAGHEVHAVSSSSPDPAADGPVWHRADLLDPASAPRLIERVRPDLMLHLAWDVTPGAFWSAPGNVRWVEATLALMRAFVAGGGSRAVLAGTCAEYDWHSLQAHTPRRCNERDTPLSPHTLYGACKHATHVAAEALAEQAGVALAWGRIFHLYGPGEQQGRLVPSVARALLAGTPARTTTGSQVRDFAHVRDAAAGFVALLESPVCGAVNVATGDGVTVRSVIELIAAEAGHPELVEWGAIRIPEGEPPELVADVARLREEVGFKPRTELAAGLRETVEWWRAEG